LVRAALALHLDVEPEIITPDMRLDEDLGLDPLDLVLVVLRLEEVAEAELPIGELEGVATVGELTAIVVQWTRARDTQPPPMRRTTSGIRPLVDGRRRVGT
jgi:acyl carrier protein